MQKSEVAETASTTTGPGAFCLDINISSVTVTTQMKAKTSVLENNEQESKR